MARGINKMFTLTRKVTLNINRASGAGDYSDTTGSWIPASPTTVPIEANVQPFKPSQTLMLAESERTREWLNIWSQTEIKKMVEGAGGNDADTFTYNNKFYKVMTVQTYKMGVLDHYKATAALDSPTPIGVDLNG